MVEFVIMCNGRSDRRAEPGHTTAGCEWWLRSCIPRFSTDQQMEDVMTRNVPARRKIVRAWSSGMLRHALAAAAIIALPVSIGACTHGHAHRDGVQQEYVVHLTNDLAPPSDVTVYAIG